MMLLSKTRPQLSRLPINNVFVRLRPTGVRTLTGVKIGVLNETDDLEKRVCLVPQHVSILTKKGAKVSVVEDAGKAAGFSNEAYKAAGASITDSSGIFDSSVILSLYCPNLKSIKEVENRLFITQFSNLNQEDMKKTLEALCQKGSTAMNLNSLLRTLSRGQNYDVMSSQANIAGYRAVLEASYLFDRPFAGQTTAAGKVHPARILVLGTGVAGLAAIQAAKNLGGIVRAFDVRKVAEEQVRAVGATFVDVDKYMKDKGIKLAEGGEGEGGYAKEMSKEWFEIARQMLKEECTKTDVIVTTAQVPGKKAPLLITKDMVDGMPFGSVTVDLAASTGGNIETTKKDIIFVNPVNHVRCVGYTNMNSRMPGISSTLFSGNVSKLLQDMSVQKDSKNQTTGEKTSEKQYDFVVNEKDEAVRSMLVVHNGKTLEPYRPPPKEAKQAAGETKAVEKPVDIKTLTWNNSLISAGAASTAVTVGSKIPDVGMLSTFALSVYLGSVAVRGVAHSLHSPLMSITNAISGMTIVGGMLQLGGGILPTNVPQYLATLAVGLSAVNLTGGFLITKKMLDMFRRPTDPPEYFQYYLIPPVTVATGLGVMAATGLASPQLASSVALASGLFCVGGIGLMSKQDTSRLANYVALGGVTMGLSSTLYLMNPANSAVYFQLAGASIIGGVIGNEIAKRVGPTQLPQAVAGFHSLVGIAALSTAVGDFLVHDLSHIDGFHSTSIYLGAWMGAITATGSVIASGKLAEKLSSKPLSLPKRDWINASMGAGSLAGLVGFVTTKDPVIAASCLGLGSVLSSLLGLHMTSSIGGADMPVVITLLNSYSGWALCAEGFILDKPLLTVVGALIGSSGAFLTKIMCDGMNRSLPNVILGGFGTESGSVNTAHGLSHTEINVMETAQALKDASKICIVPGYGLAVAQAQGDLAAIAKKLRDEGKVVKFAVHPVAGRMPGQLNVLLAEAGVPYDMVHELEEVNPEMESFDVCLVVGANDTINSAAKEDPKSAIAGMPVIEVWRSKHVIISKRSVASGYAGVDNPVFYKKNTDMLLGSATQTCAQLRSAV